jgi:linoleoyl-CoA desaturase
MFPGGKCCRRSAHELRQLLRLRYLLIGTHFCEETEFPLAMGNGVIDRIGQRMVCSPRSTGIRTAGSRIFGGRVQCHAAHHLFPNVSHAHYIALTRIVTATAREYGLPYNVTTFPEMVRPISDFSSGWARPTLL